MTDRSPRDGTARWLERLDGPGYWILTVERNWNTNRYEEFVFDGFIHVLARYGTELESSDIPNP